MLTVWGLLLVLGVAAMIRTRFTRSQMSSRDLAWFAATPHCPPPEATVYSRYLERHRRHRLVGGLFGVVFAASVGLRWFGTVTLGLGEGSPLADVLFCGLAGVIIGTLSAESFRLSEPPSSTIAASLVTREDYSLPDIRLIARGVTAAAAIAGVIVAVTGKGFAPLLIAIGGAASLAVAEKTQAAISSRRRPVLSDQAKSADLRMRSFASASVARLQLAMALLVAGWTIAKIPDISLDVLSLARGIGATGCLIVAVVLLRKAAPYPPRDWTGEMAT